MLRKKVFKIFKSFFTRFAVLLRASSYNERVKRNRGFFKEPAVCKTEEGENKIREGGLRAYS